MSCTDDIGSFVALSDGLRQYERPLVVRYEERWRSGLWRPSRNGFAASTGDDSIVEAMLRGIEQAGRFSFKIGSGAPREISLAGGREAVQDFRDRCGASSDRAST